MRIRVVCLALGNLYGLLWKQFFSSHLVSFYFEFKYSMILWCFFIPRIGSWEGNFNFFFFWMECGTFHLFAFLLFFGSFFLTVISFFVCSKTKNCINSAIFLFSRFLNFIFSLCDNLIGAWLFSASSIVVDLIAWARICLVKTDYIDEISSCLLPSKIRRLDKEIFWKQVSHCFYCK